jgi:CBS domain-containing protein
MTKESGMKVQALITGKRVHTITADSTISDLVEKLSALKVGALVVSPDGKKIDGIVSERDVVAAMPVHFHQLDKLHVRDIMTATVTTASAENVVTELMNLMTDKRIRHIPIVDEDGLLISIISIGDIVKAHVAEIDSERNALIEYVQNPR